MWNSFCKWRCFKQLYVTFFSPIVFDNNSALFIALRKKTLYTHSVSANGSSGIRPVSSAAVDTTVRFENCQLLHRLLWRAEDIIFSNASDAVERLETENKKIGTAENNHQSHISNVNTMELFDGKWDGVTWSAQDGSLATTNCSPLSSEESITLLCELLAMALKLRGSGASQEFFSLQATMMVPPLKATEALYAPLSRQGRLWGEQRGWNVLLASAAVTFGRVCDECVSEAELGSVVRQFLDKLENFSLPAAARRSKLGCLQRPRKGNKKAALLPRDTMPNILWRLTLFFRVMESLLLFDVQSHRSCTSLLSLSQLSSHGYAGESHECIKGIGEKKGRFKALVRCMMQEVEGRMFNFHNPNEVMEQSKGLEAFVNKSFYYCFECERGEMRPREYKKELENALISFCGAYFKIMPLYILIEAAKPPTTDATGGDGLCAIKVLRTIRWFWLRQESTMHLYGVQRAFWWLRLVPIIFEALFDMSTQLNKEQTNTNIYKVYLEEAQRELHDMFCSMLYFNEKAFEERRAALLAQQKNFSGDVNTSETSDNSAYTDDNSTISGNNEISGTRRLGRHRGGRSLFKKGDEKEAVLLPSSTEALRKFSRFSSRRSGVAGDANHKAAECGLREALINSPLFEMIVASKDAVAELSDLFAVDNFYRSSALEVTWLSLLTVYRRIQETRSALGLPQSQEQQHQLRLVMTVEKAYEKKIVEGEEGVSQLILPFFVVASLQQFSTALAAAVHRVYEMTDPMYLRGGNVRRTVGVAIVAGTLGTLLQNYFYVDALKSNWWLRSGATFFFHYYNNNNKKLCSPSVLMMLERNLMDLLAQRTRLHHDLEWLKQSTMTAINSLSSSFSAFANVPLSPVTKQWAAALIVANLRDVLYLIKFDAGRKTISDGDFGGSLVSPTMQAEEKDTRENELQKWVFEVFSSFLSVLTADNELLLLCGYASFIDVLFELHSRLGTNEEEVAMFCDKAFFKVIYPALLISLTKSAEEDNTETHAAACESALFIIAELSRFVFLLEVKLPSKLRTKDNDFLISLALYCLRHARRGGGKQPSGYGLPAAQLPPVKNTGVMNISATVSFFLEKNSGLSYLHILEVSNSLLSFSKLQTLFGDRESGCVSALQHYLQNLQFVSFSSSDQKRLLEESLKCLSFMATNSVSAHVLGYLVRFIEYHLRVQERLSRVPHESSSFNAVNDGRRENAISSLTRIEAAPLVLLDYIGYLTSAGSWTMVTWAFNLAETSLRIQRKHQLATTTSLTDVAKTTILSQLRALATPSTPQRLPRNLLKSIMCLSDMISGSQTTLLGFERNSLLSTLLNNTTRGEYRTMLFALKQAVLLVQMTSLKYRLPQPQSRERMDKEGDVLVENNASRQLEKDSGENEEQMYFTASAAKHSSEEQRQLRVFLDCLVACFDAVLDVVRGCAFQQDILDDELREVLLLILQTLFRVLQGCLQAVLAASHDACGRFYEERAHMLWVGVCVAALLGRTVAADYTRVCFRGNIRRSTESVLGTIKELIELCINDTSSTVANFSYDKCDGSVLKNSDSKQCGKQQQMCKNTPLVNLLTTAVKTILSDPQVSHRLSTRLGLGMRQRTDFTALVFAIRAFAVASARYKPAGSLVNCLWRAVCAEVMRVKRPSTRKGKRLKSVVQNSSLCVPSKDELQLLLESFYDMQKELTTTAISRKTQSRQADFVVDWACPNIPRFLDSVTEDQSMLRTDDAYDLVASDRGKDDVDELSLDGTFSGMAMANTGSLMGMDAALLLQEEVNEGDGNYVGGDVKAINEKVLNHEFLRALVSQCRRVHMSSGVVVVDDNTALSIPQTAKVIAMHYECVKAAFSRCTLTEIVTFPRAEFIFATLEIFSHKRSPVPRENCRVLWLKLTAGLKNEFLEPHSDGFEKVQRMLMDLVRQRRSLLRLTEKDGTSGYTTTTTITTTGLAAMCFSFGQLFRLKENVMAQLARHELPPVPSDVELLPHDDIRGVEEELKKTVVNFQSIGSCVDSFLQREKRQEHVPLDILLTLLIDIPRGPRSEVELGNLARVVITYVARRYILLRERTDKHVMNIMQFSGELGKSNERVYVRRRLPPSCTHAAGVAGWFFTLEERQDFMGLFAKHAAGGTDDDVDGVVGSAEHAFFTYMRSACLYLHLLALAAHVCHRFRMFSEIDYGDAVQQQQQRQQSNRDFGYYDDNWKGGREVTVWSRTVCNQEVDARLAELRIRADSRQTDVDSVNMNLLESILLHFLNVGLAIVDHADFITHRASSIAITPDSNHERAQKALLYADELRLMVAVALQDTLRVLLKDAPLEFSLARRVANRIICSFSCDLISITPLTGTCTEKQRNSSQIFSQVNQVALKAWHHKRPELFVRSPTLLSILSPSFFNGFFSQHIPSASSSSVTQIVAALRFYLRRPDAYLAPLMSATTSILSSTVVRNAALRLFCEELCGQIVDRPSFREALAPPTVASAQKGVAGSVPNEVLIPFLASICREDAAVGKTVLASVLYHSMHLRLDVFGQPPTANRLDKLAITKRTGNACNSNNNFKSSAGDGSAKGRLSLGGVQQKDVLLESPMSSDVSGSAATSSVLNAEDEEQDELEALDRFKADQSDETATRTHKHALASLNLTLAEVMETAMHFAAMRQLSVEEHKKARAMIRSADDARHERIAAFRSSVFVPVTNHYSNDGTSLPFERSVAGHPDAALRIEEPMHFGVVLLHIRFALRKIIHISMRRLASQQGPRTLSMMVEMLREVDPKWHRSHNSNDGANTTNNNTPRRQSDGMLAGTLRVLVARSVMCVDLAGEDTDAVGGGVGGIAISAVGMQRTKRALSTVRRAKYYDSNNNNNDCDSSDIAAGGSEDSGGIWNGGNRHRRQQLRRGGAANALSASKRFSARVA